MNLTHDRPITISVGKSRKATQWEPKQLSISDFYAMLSTPRRSSETLAEYMAMAKAQQDDLKDVGGFVGGALNGPRRKANNVTGRDVITLDFDNVPAEQTDTVIKKVEALGCSYAIYTTRKHKPSAPRMRVCIPTDRTVTSDEYVPLARLVADQISMEWADPTTFDVSRMMYFPSCSADGEFVYRVGDKPLLPVDLWLATHTQYIGDWRDPANWVKAPNAPVEKRPTTAYSVPGSIPEGQRTTELMKMLGSMQSKGYTDGAIRAAIMEENESRCNPPLTSAELESTVFPALNRFQKGTASYMLDREFDPVISGFVERLKELHPEANKRYGWHDAGNGNLFSDMSRGRVYYVPERKKWYFYDGRRWAADPGNTHTMELCKRLADALMIYTTQNIVDEKLRGDYIKHVAKWQGLKCRETILKDASTVDPVSAGIFDTDRYLLNCQNGTLNLKTLEFYDHSSDDNITKLANVEYHPEARCERWERFISEVTNGDANLSRYIQKALGYALTGDTKHECFFILYGATSRNGKGTLSETFMCLMGDYGRTASPETIAKRKNSDSRAASEDVARLAGARFVNMSEPDKGMALNAALVKTLTGNDTINARYLNENSFEFKPHFKIFIGTNHLPYASDATLFTSGRVKVIPFNRHFEEYEQDRQLKQKLSKPESLSGILNWCIEGLKLLNAEGLSVPRAVLEATLSYNEISDKVGQFVSECLVENPQAKIAAKEAHTIYQNWCVDNGFRAKGYDEFMKSLASAGIKTKRDRIVGAGRNANKVNFILGYEAKI